MTEKFSAPASSLRASLLAHLDGLIAGCREASDCSPGEWWVPQGDWRRSKEVRCGTEADSALVADTCLAPGAATHIAQHSPDFMLRLYEGLRAEVERHRLRETLRGWNPQTTGWFCAACPGMPTFDFADGDCQWITRWASLLGVGGGACDHATLDEAVACTDDAAPTADPTPTRDDETDDDGWCGETAPHEPHQRVNVRDVCPGVEWVPETPKPGEAKRVRCGSPDVQTESGGVWAYCAPCRWAFDWESGEIDRVVLGIVRRAIAHNAGAVVDVWRSKPDVLVRCPSWPRAQEAAKALAAAGYNVATDDTGKYATEEGDPGSIVRVLPPSAGAATPHAEGEPTKVRTITDTLLRKTVTDQERILRDLGVPVDPSGSHMDGLLTSLRLLRDQGRVADLAAALGLPAPPPAVPQAPERADDDCDDPCPPTPLPDPPCPRHGVAQAPERSEPERRVEGGRTAAEALAEFEGRPLTPPPAGSEGSER